jgi:hypothetical protein
MGPQAFNPQADNIDLIPKRHLFGGVSERPKEPVLKTGVVQATVGSNPTPTALQVSVNYEDYSCVFMQWTIRSCLKER